MFNHRYRYIFIIVLATYCYLNTVICQLYYHFNIAIEWYYAFGTILLVTFCTWESSRLLTGYFNKHISVSGNNIKAQLYFFLLASLFTTLFTIAVVFLVSMFLHNHSFSETIIPLKLNLIYAWLANLLFHLIHAITFYFTQYKNKFMEAEELRKISAVSELQLIKSQINPHFLFNNLNVLSALVVKNTEEANRFIEEFSKVYRYILNNHDKELVDIKTEMSFIKPYIFLLKKRFGLGIHINIDIPNSMETFYIIPAALQMLIENAIKHNIVSKNKPLYITVSAHENNTLIISNNLQLRETVDGSSKIGLSNIIKRYWLVSGKKVLVEKNPEAFTVTLPLLSLN